MTKINQSNQLFLHQFEQKAYHTFRELEKYAKVIKDINSRSKADRIRRF